MRTEASRLMLPVSAGGDKWLTYDQFRFGGEGVNSKDPDRGALLIISGEVDKTVPSPIANASYKKVSDTALSFVKRFV